MLGALQTVCARRTALSTFFSAPATARTLSTTAHAPPKRGAVQTPEAFLGAIGRKAADRVGEPDWAAFWKTDALALKKAGLPVRDRRYILWAMNKYRLGQMPETFAHEAPAKKTVRGCVRSGVLRTACTDLCAADGARRCRTGSGSGRAGSSSGGYPCSMYATLSS
jgi:hypothetical protein